MAENNIKIPQGYIPSDAEDFMNPVMLEYFKQKLLNWKEQLELENTEAIETLRENQEKKLPDDIDNANIDRNMAFALRTRDRSVKLIKKINNSLSMIEHGSYGYCLGTGEPISIKRLEARPIAVYSIEYQEKHEAMEKLSI